MRSLSERFFKELLMLLCCQHKVGIILYPDSYQLLKQAVEWREAPKLKRDFILLLHKNLGSSSELTSRRFGTDKSKTFTQCTINTWNVLL